MTESRRYRVVQPWGVDVDVPTQSTIISDHATIGDAFAAIDSMSQRMADTGAPSDAVPLVVLDDAGRVVPRPRTH